MKDLNVRSGVSGRFLRSKIYGVGVDDVEGTKEKFVDGSRVTDKCFSTWKNMLKRCYHNKGEYKGKVKVSDEWFKFSKFKDWYCKHYVEGYELDKDICGGRLYSSKTCVFVPREVNSYLVNIHNDCGYYFEESRNKY